MEQVTKLWKMNLHNTGPNEKKLSFCLPGVKYLLKLHGFYLSLVLFYYDKAHKTIWNPTPTKNVNMCFVVFFYCDKAHETILNPTPTKNVNVYFVFFLLRK